jgi:hypothetical protein
LSRLFESSFGDNADEADVRPIASEPDAPAPPPGAPLASEPADADESTLPDDAAYEIPDFEKDERDLSSYDDAQRRHLRQEIANAERDIDATFAQKREALEREVKSAKSFEDERREKAVQATRQYANRYPHHVDKKGINPPGFFENLFSFGSAGRLYRAAFVAGEALEQLRATMRKREESLAALEGQLQRTLVLKEEAIKKALESPAGIAEFNERPEIKPLFKRVQAIKKERADYERRLEQGEATDEEQRDRAIAEFNLTYAQLPIMGAIVARVARFGQLSYFQLRDLEKRESLLSYDPRLDPLRNTVFDVYAVAGSVAAKIKRNDNGTAFRVADHFKTVWRNEEKAEELYGQHRSALREDRGLAPMAPRDDAEAELIERLANLATMVDGGGGRDPLPAPSRT